MKNSAPDEKQSPAKGRKGRCLNDTNQLGKVVNFNENFQVGAGREAFSTGRRMSSLEIDCFSNHLFAMFNRHTSVI